MVRTSPPRCPRLPPSAPATRRDSRHNEVPPRERYGVAPGNGTRCHPVPFPGATRDATLGATRRATGCSSKRYELQTGLPPGSLRGANQSVTRDTAGCCPQRDGLTAGVLVGHTRVIVRLRSVSDDVVTTDFIAVVAVVFCRCHCCWW